MNEKSTRFFKLVRDFLTVNLPDQRTVSVNTIKSYRECLNQLLSYICDRNGFALGKLSFEYLSRETVARVGKGLRSSSSGVIFSSHGDWYFPQFVEFF